MDTDTPTLNQTAAALRAMQRGGGPVTRVAFQPLGSFVAAAGYRRGYTPDALTLTGLCVAMLGALAAASALWRPEMLVLALALWLAAYVFDCADGQLARFTKTSSTRGARLDVSSDLLSHVAASCVLGVVGLAMGANALAVMGVVSTRMIATTLSLMNMEQGVASKGGWPLAPIRIFVDHPMQISLIVIALILGATATNVVFAVLALLAVLQVLRVLVGSMNR